MAQSDALYEILTGYENLEFFGKMKGVPSKQLKEEIAYVAKIVDLTNHLKKISIELFRWDEAKTFSRHCINR